MDKVANPTLRDTFFQANVYMAEPVKGLHLNLQEKGL